MKRKQFEIVVREARTGRVISSVAMTPEENALLRKYNLTVAEVWKEGLKACLKKIEETETKKIVIPENYPLTKAEIEEITHCAAEHVIELWDWKWQERRREYGFHPKLFNYGDWEQTHLPGLLWNKLKEHKDDIEFFKPLNLRAEEILEARFQKDFLTPIAGGWTLKAICETISDKDKSHGRWTVTEIAATLNLPYQVVYNKIVPLLRDMFVIKD